LQGELPIKYRDFVIKRGGEPQAMMNHHGWFD
jgi:hypothetical protein